MTDTTAAVHIYFVLDRSGSMASIADDVIGGFNSFVASQRAEGPDALMTLIQFDSQDSHEVLCDAVGIEQVPDLTPARFVPRGGTPLYDAMGHAIADASIRSEQQTRNTDGAEEIVFVTFTDGQENQSVEYTRDKIFDLIKKRSDAGWTFAYLGANQDAYAEAERIGMSAGSIQAYRADGAGAQVAYASLASAVTKRRTKIREGTQYDAGDLFEGDKAAEQDLHDRN